jgi:hypothetical protein
LWAHQLTWRWGEDAFRNISKREEYGGEREKERTGVERRERGRERGGREKSIAHSRCPCRQTKRKDREKGGEMKNNIDENLLKKIIKHQQFEKTLNNFFL